jgi:hypothetical protein
MSDSPKPVSEAGLRAAARLRSCAFIPFTVETYGRLGKPALRLLARLGQEAAESAGGVSKSGFVAEAIRELSVGMCRGNFYVYRDGYGLLAGALGRGFALAWPGRRMR